MNSENRKLLVVEDDPGLQSQLRWCFEGYDVVIAGDKESALVELRRHEPPVVTLDLGLPPDPANVSVGLETLQEILKLSPHTKIIVVTGNEDHENAVKSIALGAYDFYQKPVDAQLLGLIVDRAHRLYALEKENRRLVAQGGNSPLGGIIASSPEMVKACRMVEKVAPTDATTLILGESGTGKELFARALHDLSLRSEKRFVAINCAAIPDTLLESELFGYEKGAFTGAAKQTKGKIECAHGGTLFLDEIGDLPGALQAKLLRFLQERVIERVGGREEIPIDVRVVCATHQNLDSLIQDGGFRQDLYFRISEIRLEIPPLRKRQGDIVTIGRALLQRQAQQQGCSLRGFSDDAIAALDAYEWPGNVRELENRIKRAVIMAEGAQVTAEDLELAVPDEQIPLSTLRQVREDAERKALKRALTRADGNMSRAAEVLGITRPTLYSLLEKYQMRE